MVGLRWVGCCALLALSCARTASSDSKPSLTEGGSSAISGASGAGPSGQGGEAGQDPDCPATPASGRWIASGPDPFVFVIESDGSHLSGRGCLGAPLEDDDDDRACAPLKIRADTGRRLEFFCDFSKAVGQNYGVEVKVTLSPERTAMAGSVWSPFVPEGQDIALVRYPDEPVAPPTACSGGEPSGECFLSPLRSDRLKQLEVVALDEDNLILAWINRRAIEERLAVARFDAASGAWRAAEFLDDGSSRVDFARVVAGSNGSAMAAYAQGAALLTRSYDAVAGAWSEQRVVPTTSAGSVHPLGLFVHDGGDATLVTSAVDPSSGENTLSVHAYVGATGAWEPARLIEDVVSGGVPNAAAASDAAGNVLVAWVRSGLMGEMNGLWFSRRSADGEWSEPAVLQRASAQLLRPALTVGEGGMAIVTWQELSGRIASRSYSFATNTWSEPLTVVTATNAENGSVVFGENGEAIAYFQLNDVASPRHRKSELSEGVWSVAQPVSDEEAGGAAYKVMVASDAVVVERLHPAAGEHAFPALARQRCEGY
jgi:hypothetical protein